jgi:hypothetical protein
MSYHTSAQRRLPDGMPPPELSDEWRAALHAAWITNDAVHRVRLRMIRRALQRGHLGLALALIDGALRKKGDRG